MQEKKKEERKKKPKGCPGIVYLAWKQETEIKPTEG